jgi:hypothetical protein
MSTRYLSDLVQTVRDRGDYRNPVKFTDEIITREVQAAFAELYQIITGVNEGYFDTTATLTTTANVAYVALPSDSWRVRAIDRIDSSGCPVLLDQVGIDQRNRYGITASCPVAYRLTARGVDLYPTPDQAYTLRLLYTPSAPDLRAPVYVGSSTATFVGVPTTGTVTTPSGVAAGDTMLIIVAGASVITVPDGWYSVLTLTSANAVPCTILRRTADGAEANTYDVIVGGTCGMAMLVYRNLDTIADIVDSSISDVTTSRSFACPALTLAATTDLYVGIVASTDSATTFSPPFATMERIDVTQGTKRIATFDVQPGSIGDTGAKTALAVTTRTGIAASIALAVNPSREFYNGWEEYIIYGACIRLSGEEESTRSDWVTLQDRARQMAVSGATGRRSAEPQLIPLMDDGW